MNKQVTPQLAAPLQTDKWTTL